MERIIIGNPETLKILGQPVAHFYGNSMHVYVPLPQDRHIRQEMFFRRIHSTREGLATDDAIRIVDYEGFRMSHIRLGFWNGGRCPWVSPDFALDVLVSLHSLLFDDSPASLKYKFEQSLSRATVTTMYVNLVDWVQKKKSDAMKQKNDKNMRNEPCLKWDNFRPKSIPISFWDDQVLRFIDSHSVVTLTAPATSPNRLLQWLKRKAPASTPQRDHQAQVALMPAKNVQSQRMSSASRGRDPQDAWYPVVPDSRNARTRGRSVGTSDTGNSSLRRGGAPRTARPMPRLRMYSPRVAITRKGKSKAKQNISTAI